MQLHPDDGVYYPGNTITCHAGGNPELRTDNGDYQWINLNTSAITCGSALIIADDMVDRSFAYRCRACNNYLGEPHCATLDTNFYVSGKPATYNPSHICSIWI